MGTSGNSLASSPELLAGKLTATGVIPADANVVALSIRDDGVGIGADASGGNGLRNMAARAESLGGSCSISAGTVSGTVVSWMVPVPG